MRHIRTIAAVAIIAFAVSLSARGQVSSAIILGQVRDQTQAPIPGVKVTARNRATGFTRATTTNEDGEFLVGDLLPGMYTIAAEKQGFKTIVLDTVLLEVNQKVRLDLTAQVGQTQES